MSFLLKLHDFFRMIKGLLLLPKDQSLEKKKYLYSTKEVNKSYLCQQGNKIEAPKKIKDMKKELEQVKFDLEQEKRHSFELEDKIEYLKIHVQVGSLSLIKLLKCWFNSHQENLQLNQQMNI